ncbi:MAG: glycosyltransferase [Patescibacteria group bacterium]|jgi:glycosyltransferase involved in cell wall biosynthesis
MLNKPLKKILIVINSLSFGGAERLVVNQANYLRMAGYEVDVLTILPKKPGFYDNLIFSGGKLLHIDAGGFSLRGIWMIAKIIRRGKYEVIMTHLFLANTLVRLACLFIFWPGKIIAYEHNVYKNEKRFKHLLIDRLLSFLTHKIVAVSDEVEDYLIKNGISKNKITVIQNGVSADNLKNILSPSQIRKELGFTKEDILVVSNGNINPQKGYETLIKAAEKVIGRNPKINFLICGLDTSQYSQSLKNQALNSRYSNQIHFLGARPDAVAIVNCADIFVMPSLWEGLSLSLLESLMLGKIVVVSDIPSMTALVKNGYNGITFVAGDAEALAKAIINIVGHPVNFQSIKDKAKETGESYSIEKNIERIIFIID